MTVDAFLFNFLHSFAGRSPALDFLIIFFATYLPWIMAAAFLYLILANRPFLEARRIVIELVAALFVGRIVITGGIRYLVHRARPFTLPDAQSLFVTTGSSFPSAHATLLFAGGTIVYAYDRRLGIAFYALSALVCLARIMAGVHYPSDIVAGMGAGLVAGAGVLWAARRLKA